MKNKEIISKISRIKSLCSNKNGVVISEFFPYNIIQKNKEDRINNIAKIYSKVDDKGVIKFPNDFHDGKTWGEYTGLYKVTQDEIEMAKQKVQAMQNKQSSASTALQFVAEKFPLKYMMQGENVKKLQQALNIVNKKGQPNITGKFYNVTQGALEAKVKELGIAYDKNKGLDQTAFNQIISKQPIQEQISRIKSMMKKLINEDFSSDVDEMNYQSFHNDENLQDLRDALEKNKMISVAYVKKDGSVRHMLVKRHLSSYVASDAPKSDAQLNVDSNNDIKKVIDINSYKKELKNLRAENPFGDENMLKQMASKKAWRTVNLKTVLGFMVGGRFIDLRDENEIRERFGEDVYNSLTRSMIRSMEQDQPVVAQPEPEIPQIGEPSSVLDDTDDERQERNYGVEDIDRKTEDDNL